MKSHMLRPYVMSIGRAFQSSLDSINESIESIDAFDEERSIMVEGAPRIRRWIAGAGRRREGGDGDEEEDDDDQAVQAPKEDGDEEEDDDQAVHSPKEDSDEEEDDDKAVHSPKEDGDEEEEENELERLEREYEEAEGEGGWIESKTERIDGKLGTPEWSKKITIDDEDGEEEEDEDEKDEEGEEKNNFERDRVVYQALRISNANFARYRGDRKPEFSEMRYVTPQTFHDLPRMPIWQDRPIFSKSSFAAPRSRAVERRQAEFLETPYQPRHDDRPWVGKRLLGEGAFGMVGLWEYLDPKTGEASRMAVKQTLRENLREERNILYKLKGRSPHCVQLIGPLPEHDTEQEYDRKHGKLVPSVKAILMEYCPGGDLLSRLKSVAKSDTALEELQLWQMFNCLIKALKVLDGGAQNESPLPDDVPYRPTRWSHIVHFDIKPANIMLGDDGEDEGFSTCKIGDFGIAQRLVSAKKQLPRLLDRIRYRDYGTPGYKPPEQFSRRWQHLGWEKDKELTYGTHTNIWMIGIVMYQACTLVGTPQPAGRRCGDCPGLTYGHELEHFEYSENLKELIWRCLADRRSDRATLDYCAHEISKALALLDPDRIFQADNDVDAGNEASESDTSEGRAEQEARQEDEVAKVTKEDEVAKPDRKRKRSSDSESEDVAREQKQLKLDDGGK